MLKSRRFRRFALLIAAVASLLAGAHSALAANYWSGVSRALPTSPLGNVVALSCHNCYGEAPRRRRPESRSRWHATSI